MKIGALIKSNELLPLPDIASRYFPQFDKDINKTGKKRVGPIVVRQGHNADDFMLHVVSIVLTAHAYRVPRILNPLHKKVTV